MTTTVELTKIPTTRRYIQAGDVIDGETVECVDYNSITEQVRVKFEWTPWGEWLSWDSYISVYRTPMPCPVAATCTVEKCVNLNDPVAQAACKLC